MKSTGVVRKVDWIGHIVFPAELRRTLDINPGDSLEVFQDGSNIILKKYGCFFCGEAADVTEFKGKPVCPQCREELKNIYKFHRNIVSPVD